MPFIRGKYYANPIVGQALESAREAAENAGGKGDSNVEADSYDATAAHESPDPVRRVDIEITEMVPAHTGRVSKGYVARLYRTDSMMRESNNAVTAQTPEKRVFYDHNQFMDFLNRELSAHGNGQ